jgi:hypothetical protein
MAAHARAAAAAAAVCAGQAAGGALGHQVGPRTWRSWGVRGLSVGILCVRESTARPSPRPVQTPVYPTSVA